MNLPTTGYRTIDWLEGFLKTLGTIILFRTTASFIRNMARRASSTSIAASW